MIERYNLIERLAGTLLLCAIVPLALLGYFLIVIVGLFGNVDRIRQGAYAMDHFVNATIFNGYAWESVSSHAWRKRDKKWAKMVIWVTEIFQKDHCKRCNKREQDVVNLILKKRLNEQTIGKKKRKRSTMKKVYPYYPKTVKNKLSRVKNFLLDRDSWLTNLYEKSYTMKMGHVKMLKDIYMPNEPELIHRVMVSEVKLFPKHQMLHNTLKPLLGESIFTTNGKVWKKQRELLAPSFEMVKISNVFGLMDNAVKDMMFRLEALEHKDYFDIDEEMTFVTADIIFRTILSKKLSTKEGKKIVNAFTLFQEQSFKIAIQDLFLVPKVFRSKKTQKEYATSGEIIRSSLLDIIKPRYENQPQASEDKKDILAFLLEAKDEESLNPFSFEEILDQVAMLFLAGHETTASSLTWTLYLLALYPNYQEKAFQEVKKVCYEEITLENLKALTFLTNCFKESLRLYPPVSAFPREAMSDTVMRKKKIKKGSIIIISPWLMHRNERFWKDAHMFNPHRFDDAKKIIKDTYLPFGMGQRICIGAGFAMQESILVLASILKSYKIVLKPDFTPNIVGRLTTRSANGMQVKLTKRKKG